MPGGPERGSGTPLGLALACFLAAGCSGPGVLGVDRGPSIDAARSRSEPAAGSFGASAVYEIRDLSELSRYTKGPRGGFAGLPRGARPPWLWSDRRGGELGIEGEILDNPARLYEALGRSR